MMKIKNAQMGIVVVAASLLASYAMGASASPSTHLASARPAVTTTSSATSQPPSTPFPRPKEGYKNAGSVERRRIPAGAGVPGGPNTTERVVLTYDDCPKSAQKFRETVVGAEKLGVRIVIFALGTCVKAGLVDVDFAREHGHFVYGHSFNHPAFTRLSEESIRRQLAEPSVQGAWMRPPYGAANKRVEKIVNSYGMKLWQWNLDTVDYSGLTEDQVVYSVVTESQPGDTVLMHLQWNGFSTEAIRKMKDGLASRGLELCRNTGPATADGPFEC